MNSPSSSADQPSSGTVAAEAESRQDEFAAGRAASPGDLAPRLLALLVLLAVCPFVAKIGVLAFGLTNYLAQSVYKIFQLVGPVSWRRWVRGRSWIASFWPVDEPLPTGRTWMIGVGIALLLAGSAMLLVPLLAGLLGLTPEVIRAQMAGRFALTPLRAVLVVLYLLSINAGLEELHFRYWLDRELSARWNGAVGMSASAIAFGAMHTLIFAGLESATPLVLLLVFLALVIAGVAWSLLARRPGGIHAAWLSHGLTDAMLLTWGLWWLEFF